MNAGWITNADFAPLAPLDVFHREQDKSRGKITHDDKYKNRHILFRRSLDLPAFRKAVIRVTADDYYKLYLDGELTVQGPAPGYPFHYFYNEIDATDALHEGKNVIAAHTYYQGLINRVYVSGDLRHGFWFELYLDGKLFAVSDENWLTADHTGYPACGIIGYETQFAECVDASSPEYVFMLPSFDDRAWKHASIREHADYTLFAQPTKPLDIYDVRPAVLRRTENGYFLDFGFEAAGYLTFTAKGVRGDTVTLRYGEELNADGTVRYEMRCNCRYEEQFRLSGGEDTLRQYDYKAFRYAEILLPAGVTVDEDSIAFTVRHYPFTQIKRYTGNDETLRRIFELCANTVKYGVQEGYVDCPTREKGQYLGDVTIAGLAQLVLTGDPAMIMKAHDIYAESAFIDKGLMTVAPASLNQEIADYSLQFPFQVLQVYRYTGDRAYLERMWPAITGVLEWAGGFRNANGLLDNVADKWNLVDWPANLRDNYDFPLTQPIGPGLHNVINAFYLGMLETVDEIAAILGKTPTFLTEETRAAFIDAFYDPETHLFVDSAGSKHSSLHANVIPLFAGVIVDEDNKAAMVRLIEKKKLTSAGTYLAFFTLWGLKAIGETALMETLIKDEGAWRNMLKEGATTTFEAWGKDQKWNTSLFHPWSACPVILLD